MLLITETYKIKGKLDNNPAKIVNFLTPLKTYNKFDVFSMKKMKTKANKTDSGLY